MVEVLDNRSVFTKLLDSLSAEAAERVPVLQTADVVQVDDLEKYEARPVWHLIMIPPGELPVRKSFDSPGAMRKDIERCQAAEDKGGDAGRTRFFIIFGCEAFVTEPPFTHFIHPNGKALALYEKPRRLKIAQEGYSGDEEVRGMLEDEDETEEEIDLDDESTGNDSEGTADEGEEPEGEEPEPPVDAELSEAEMAATFTGSDEYEDEDVGGVSDQEPV